MLTVEGEHGRFLAACISQGTNQPCPKIIRDEHNLSMPPACAPLRQQFWPGQSRELYNKLPVGKTLIRFTEEEGADSHCEPAANGIRDERIFDWLDQHIPA